MRINNNVIVFNNLSPSSYKIYNMLSIIITVNDLRRENAFFFSQKKYFCHYILHKYNKTFCYILCKIMNNSYTE